MLRQLGVKFQVVPAEVPEVMVDQLTPLEICRINASRKARVVAGRHPDRMVLGADTLVCLGRTVFGKPATRAEAGRMLGRLQGKTHEVVTGVCLVRLSARWQRIFVDRTRVTFRRLREADIRRYLERVNPLDKAGAYAIQEHGELLVREISGSFSNVVGLPLERLEEELRGWGGLSG